MRISPLIIAVGALLPIAALVLYCGYPERPFEWLAWGIALSVPPVIAALGLGKQLEAPLPKGEIPAVPMRRDTPPPVARPAAEPSAQLAAEAGKPTRRQPPPVHKPPRGRGKLWLAHTDGIRLQLRRNPLK